MDVLLASSSPRRRGILEDLGIVFSALSPDVDETVSEADPAARAVMLAGRKARAIVDRRFGGLPPEDTLVIGCDTVVALNGEIYGQPKDAADARRMLTALSGAAHQVCTGLCLLRGDRVRTAVSKTTVFFDPIAEDDLARYLAGDEWRDKAGGYGIQSHARRWVRRIEGCYYNVVGLPVNLLLHTAAELGVKL